MKVYVITSCEAYGDNEQVESVWSTEELAYEEVRRIQPEAFGVEVNEYEVQSEVAE